MKNGNVASVTDFYLLTLLQNDFEAHLEAIKGIARARGRGERVCHISYAWPVTEAEAGLYAQLLILEEDLVRAGLDPNLDLQDVCSQEYRDQHADLRQLPKYTDLQAFRRNGIQPGGAVFMIGTASYRHQTADPYSDLHAEEAEIYELFAKKALTVVPMFYPYPGGAFPDGFPKNRDYVSNIGFIFRQGDYLRDLPKLIAHVYGIEQDEAFKQLSQTYQDHFEAVKGSLEKSEVKRDIRNRQDTLQQQLERRASKYHNHAAVRLARFSPEQRELRDGRQAESERAVRQQLVDQAAQLAVNREESTLSQWLLQHDTPLTAPTACDASGTLLWKENTPLDARFDAFARGDSAHTAWVLCGVPSGKRDWIKRQEQQLWQQWRVAQKQALDTPSILNRRTAKQTPLPVYIDLANTQSIDTPYPHLIEQGLATLGLTDAQIAWVREGQQLLLLIDGFDRIHSETNLAVRNAFHEWQVRVVYMVDEAYLKETPHRAEYFVPADANQQPQREQLAFIDLGHTTRRASVDASLDARSRPQHSAHTTGLVVEGAVLRGSSQAADPASVTRTGTTTLQSDAEASYWRAEARLLLQRRHHGDPAHELLRQLRRLADDQQTGMDQVFISYAWPRDATACRQLQARLCQLVDDSRAMGIRVLLDILQLAPGKSVRDFMLEGIKDSAAIWLIGIPHLKSRIDLGRQQPNNVQFEFENLVKKHMSHMEQISALGESPSRRASPIMPLLFGGAAADSFPHEIHDYGLSPLPFDDETQYFQHLAHFALRVLGLEAHPRAREYVADYALEYQLREAGFSDAVLNATIETAKTERQERLAKQKADFEAFSYTMGAENLKALRAAESSVIAQAVEHYISSGAEVCQPESFIAQTLKRYVPARYSQSPQFKEADVADLFEHIQAQVTQWLATTEVNSDPAVSSAQRTPGNALMILEGGSGGGKSLFLSYLERHYLEHYQVGAPIPVFIRLAQCENPNERLIDTALAAQGYEPPVIATLKQQRTPLLLLLDGFDELPLTEAMIDPKRTLYQRNALHEWNAYVVVSCRSQQLPIIERYLNTQIDSYWRRAEPQAPAPVSIAHLFITPFDDAQIEQYLRGHVAQEKGGWPLATYRDHLQRITGLKALVQNPFVLRLVCDALPLLVRQQQADPMQSSRPLTRSAIYAAFTQQWFAKEQWRLISQETLAPGDAFIENMDRWCQQHAWELLNTKRVVMALDTASTAHQRRAAPIRVLEEQSAQVHAQFIHKCRIGSWHCCQLPS